MSITVIRNGTVLAWDGTAHRAVTGGEVAFEGNTILHAGGPYEGPMDHVLNAKGSIISPGLVNAHLHVTDTAFTRGGWFEDFTTGGKGGTANHTALYNLLPTVRGATGSEDELAAAECAFAELLLSGTTTAAELGFDAEMRDGGDLGTVGRIADTAARLGVRAYVGPRYRSLRWTPGADGDVVRNHYSDGGRARFADCVRFCEEWNGRHGDLIRTMLAPGQVDTCTLELLTGSRREADRLGIPVQIHAGQSPNEYRTVMREHGMSTIALMRKTGLLGPDFLIGHGMYLTEDGIVDRFPEDELAALRDSRTTIVHLPWVKARQGSYMRSFDAFVRAGVRMAIGTDTYPFDLIQEMRVASTMSKVAEGNPSAGSAAAMFHAATVAPADGLGRPDLGRLAPGCKADIILIGTDVPHAVPLPDPVKFIVSSATGADVRTVIVDGRTAVRDRVVLGTDLPAALDRLREAGRRVHARVSL